MTLPATAPENSVLNSHYVEDLLSQVDPHVTAGSKLPSVPAINPNDLVEHGLTQQDVDNLNDTFKNRISRNTWRSYRSQWLRFTRWAIDRDVVALPAEPVFVAAYLAERFLEEGARPATLRNASAAIAYVHRAADEQNPCTSRLVAGTLGGAARMVDGEQKQAAALTEEVFDVIRAVACEPRISRGGRLESEDYANRRGRQDIAMIAIMRDALLRVSEAEALTWSDLEARRDGSGRLLIRRSKSDQENRGAIAFLSLETMAYLNDMTDRAGYRNRIIGLSANQISNRIKRAALLAGLGTRFSGHSPRVGMAVDLAREGTELPALMNAGRWASSEMPAHYIRNEDAGRNAVARYYTYDLRAGRRRTPTIRA